jgi:hypothetical protein
MPTIFSTNPTHSHSQLLSLIRQTRKQMINSALTTGLTSQETVQISQQLDRYLNLEQKHRNNS